MPSSSSSSSEGICSPAGSETRIDGASDFSTRRPYCSEQTFIIDQEIKPHGNFGKLGVLLLGERRRYAARKLRVDRTSCGGIQIGVQMILTFASADTVLVVSRARAREFDPDAVTQRRVFFVTKIRHSAGCVGTVQVQALGGFRQGVFVNVRLYS